MTIIAPLAQDYRTDTITVILSGNAFHYWYYIEVVDNQNHTWTASEERTLPEGTYSLYAYGNILSTISHASITFTIDTTPPTVTIDSPTNTTYTTSTIIIDLSGDAVYYWYYIEGIHVHNQTWTPNVDETLADGAYILHAYGNDTVGNTAYTSVTFTIDTTPPTITIDSPTNTTYTTSTIIVDLSGDAENYWYYIVGIDSINQTWNSRLSRSLPDGIYTLHAYGNDSVGNEVHISVTLTIDTTATTTTTTPKISPFPNFPIILLFFGILVEFSQRFKRMFRK